MAGIASRSVDCLLGGPCVITLPPGFQTTLEVYTATPEDLFHNALLGLGMIIVGMRSLQYLSNSWNKRRDGKSSSLSSPSASVVVSAKPKAQKSLQIRFLSVFWLLRLSFWMAGPYFYQVYASKTFNDQPATPTIISQIFLVGFASIALFSPIMGTLVDKYGRKKGTIAASIVVSIGALSTVSSSFPVLLAGRGVSGLGNNLLSSAPEAWLVSEAFKVCGDDAGTFLQQTFGLAFSYDPVIAIISGQVASFVAKSKGPTGPFTLLPAFLFGGCMIAVLFWGENKAEKSNNAAKTSQGSVTVFGAAAKIWEDKKLLLVGAIQALFEGSMYIFVSQWPPAMTAAVQEAYGPEATVPFGTAFSCFMACCMVGSGIFGNLAPGKIHLPKATYLLFVSAMSMAYATYTLSSDTGSVWGLVLSFFLFEACVGFYFPAIGMLRSNFLPESHRSVIVGLYAIPLNIIVVSVFLFIGRLGTSGSFAVATAALATATICSIILRWKRSRDLKRMFKTVASSFRRQIHVLRVISDSMQQEPVDDRKRRHGAQMHMAMSKKISVNFGM